MATEEFSISRRIEIDAAHRVPDHGSKCFHLHGHRYVIEANVRGPIYLVGEQNGMVLDFGFLKEMMMEEIHDPCDHGMILYNRDPILTQGYITPGRIDPNFVGLTDKYPGTPWLKLYLLDGPPTAEVLARHWYRLVGRRVAEFTNGQAVLDSITVRETPNSIATYPVNQARLPLRVFSGNSGGTQNG